MKPMSAYQTLITEQQGPVLHITLNRPDKLNALSIQLLQELGQVMDKVYANASIRGVILTGSGSKAFAAGADIAEFAAFTEEQGATMSADGHHVMDKISRCPKPVIAAVNGFALGGGCELAMACHMRFAAENARFGQPEVNLGLLPGYGGTQRLPMLVGMGRALELLMTGDLIDVQEAWRIGLVNKVVPAGELMAHCMKVMEKILAKGPLAIAKVVDSVHACFDKEVDGITTEVELFGRSFGTADFKEGTQAFLEKRKAEFQGK